jgi:CDP-glucose 4,6-dehydratase
MNRPGAAFWAGRRVLVTGHTGFKGAWLCLLLDHLGADVSGLALPAPRGGAFDAMRPPVESHIADMRDPALVAAAVRSARPEIVLHLAAQALVGESHARPVETFETNVMGTLHLLEALRAAPPRAALIITTDKVYHPGPTAFVEESPLGGADPYSASKVAVEHAVTAWRPRLMGCALATARAGNVLGGGDIAAGRLAPDVIKAHRNGEILTLRRPNAVRPWQYVLDVLAGYLLYAEALFRHDAPETLNFGPDPGTAVTTADLTQRLQDALGNRQGWTRSEASFPETATLLLDSRKAHDVLGWRARTNLDHALTWTAEWHRAAWNRQDMHRIGHAQIQAWMNA